MNNRQNPYPNPNPNPDDNFKWCFRAKVGLSKEEKAAAYKKIYEKVILELKDGTPRFADNDNVIVEIRENIGIVVSKKSGNWWYWDPMQEPAQYVDSGLKYLTSDYQFPTVSVPYSTYDEIMQHIDEIDTQIINNYDKYGMIEVIQIIGRTTETVNSWFAILTKTTYPNDLTANSFKLTIYDEFKENYNSEYVDFDNEGSILDANIESFVVPTTYALKNLKNDVNIHNNLLDNNTKQSFQDIRLNDHNERLVNLENEIYEFILIAAREKFFGNRWDVPTTVEVNGKNLRVIDNQKFKVRSVKGLTRKSNNLIPFPYADTDKTENGITWKVNSDGSITANGTATARSEFFISYNPNEFFTKGKTYSIIANISVENSNVLMRLVGGVDTTDLFIYNSAKQINFNKQNYVVFKLVIEARVKADNIIFKPMLNEGESILPHEPYFKGLQSTTIKDITAVGTNRWDEQWIAKGLNSSGELTPASGCISSTNKNPINPNTQYITGTNLYMAYFNKEGVFILSDYIDANQPFTTPINAHYFRFQTIGAYGETYKNDIIINVGSSALPYKPYLATSTKTNLNITLKGAGEAYDEAILTNTPNTELYEVDVVRRIKEIDMGVELAWRYDSEYNFFYAALSDIVRPANNYTSVNALTKRYSTIAFSKFDRKADNVLTVSSTVSRLVIRESVYNDNVVNFTNSLKGVKLLYETTTPTTTKPEDYQNLTLDEISVTGQKGGEISINPIEPNIVEPKEVEMEFDVRYWEEPAPASNEGGNL